ncbi:MAG: hypothetical protein ABIQ53_08260 [Terracoccus sp.]
MGGDGTYTIGPGFWGFVAFFVMAIALWLLVRNMSGRLRRMAYQERERDGVSTDRKQTGRGGQSERRAPSGPLDLASSDRLWESPNSTGLPEEPNARPRETDEPPADEPPRPDRPHEEMT